MVMSEGLAEGDSCSLPKDSTEEVDKSGPKGVTSCLGNVTAVREREHEIPSCTLLNGVLGTRTSKLAR